MKMGRVVRVRVSPDDCMACVDIIKQVGGDVLVGASFAQVVSLSLRSLIQSAREGGAIPHRDGFEYSEMMQPYADQPHLDRERKLKISTTIETIKKIKPLIPGTKQDDPERQRRRVRFEELRFRIGQDRLNVSEAEILEYSELGLEFETAGTD